MTEISAPKTCDSKNKECERAALIYKYAYSSASSLLQLFERARATRKAPQGDKSSGKKPRGTTTDQEQDLLRAMLVMAGAGLDACLKQLIRDALPGLAERDPNVQKGLEKFLAQTLGSRDLGSDAAAGGKFLATLLAARDPRSRAIDEYLRELTGDSLQSADQVLSAVAALGLDYRALALEPDELRSVFQVRNQIIHEFDADLAGKRRKRNVRSLPDMVDHVNTVLNTAHAIIAAVDKRCEPPERSNEAGEPAREPTEEPA